MGKVLTMETLKRLFRKLEHKRKEEIMLSYSIYRKATQKTQVKKLIMIKRRSRRLHKYAKLTIK